MIVTSHDSIVWHPTDKWHTDETHLQINWISRKFSPLNTIFKKEFFWDGHSHCMKKNCSYSKLYSWKLTNTTNELPQWNTSSFKNSNTILLVQKEEDEKRRSGIKLLLYKSLSWRDHFRTFRYFIGKLFQNHIASYTSSEWYSTNGVVWCLLRILFDLKSAFIIEFYLKAISV